MAHPPVRAALAGAGIALILGAAGCSTSGDLAKRIGFTRETPNEFNVAPRKPLQLPPSLTALPPPRPGAPSPLDPRPSLEAQVALRGAGAPVVSGQGSSAGEAALLARAGSSDPAIRGSLDSEELQRERRYGLTTLFGLRVPDGSEEELLESREEAEKLRARGVATPVPPPEPAPETGPYRLF